MMEKSLDNFVWTKHALSKMKFYGLTESRLKKVFRNPDRRQEGIAPDTIAIMQRIGQKRKTEIWMMYEDVGSGKKKIITAWRFPGISQKGEIIPMPDDIKRLIKI
jgi:hypothetical protein